ncbi:MAG TPA: GAF domain-containing protein, partial [Planctomycetota bacterium]|nr:GAF domain-containing protein [Planctomycetota bacterium]
EDHLRLLENLGLRSALTVPILGGDRVLGAITFCRAESDRGYTPRDQAVAEDLGRRAGLAVENARLYEKAREEALERGRAQAREARRARQALVGAQVGRALTTSPTGREMLQRSAQALVDHLDAALARIWTLNEAENVLELQASAGMSAPIEGAQGRVPVGTSMIGKIAAEGRPLLTQDVGADPLLGEPGEGRKAAILSFAGYPLKLDGRVVGVMGLFSGAPLSEDTVEGLASIADSIAVGLERKRKETQLQELNARLEERVQERTAELQAANRELEAFSYSVSHDLRGPLRSMDGFSQVLLRQYADRLDERGQKYLHRVCAAAEKMGRLIDDFLNLSRLTRAPLSFERLDLSQMAREILAELRRADPGRSVEAVVAPDLAVRGDPRLLRVVLENLLGNAWKFTRAKKTARIEVASCAREGSKAFVVRDDGAGFDMSYVGKLFKPFERLHAVEEYPGTGIGLASVQRIIARHGGRVWAEGEPGRGAAFYFSLDG